MNYDTSLQVLDVRSSRCFADRPFVNYSLTHQACVSTFRSFHIPIFIWLRNDAPALQQQSGSHLLSGRAIASLSRALL